VLKPTARVASRPRELSLALASWCARTGGRAANFTVRNRCNLPRRAHQQASAYNIFNDRERG